MDITKENHNPNPRENANPLSILFFTYTIGMFKKGYSKTLETEDLYNPLSSDKSQTLGDRLEQKWLKHLEKNKKLNKKPSLLKVLVATFWPEYTYLGVLIAVMEIGFRLLQPIMLGKLLEYFRPGTEMTKNEALGYAGAIVGLNAISAVFINQYIVAAFHYGMKVRAACCAIVYRKALKLSNTALGQTASGQVVNLLSNDVSRFDIVSVFIHHMWIAPTCALIVTYFLWAEAGLAGIIGIIPVFLVVPLQSYTGKLSAKYRKQTAYKTDERVRLMDEIISGVQVIKMYAWEKPFAKLIKHARRLELRVITKLSYVRALFMTFNLFTTRVALFCTLLTMTLLYNEPITAAKALKLSNTALGQTASGQVVNLLSNDVSRFDIVSVFIHHMWIAPTCALIVTYFLWAEAGLAGIIGIIPVFLVVPLQSYTGKLSAKYRKQTAYKTDERVRLMDEIISGVQVIKMYAWEKPFAKLIKHARRLELRVITKLSYVRALFMTFNLFTTRVALFCTLLTMTLLYNEPITAAKVFVFMSYYNIISQTMSSMFVRGIAEVAELFVSIKRLQNFLLNEEFIDNSKINNNLSSPVNNNIAVSMKAVTASWVPDSSEHALNGMTVTIDRGQTVGIIGPVGAGKTSFLHALLGELHLTSGDLVVNGTVSYASQEPWVFAATVRQNIVFGQEYNKHRYNDVVRVCALDKDFKQFPHGDMTIVGDRGASLSGGQKARINLARAVYRNADIYLLDDPLSAVDVHVAKHLYEQCINGYLRKKTKILVTHQVHHLKNANNIIILDNGSISAQGKFYELANTDLHYAQLLNKEPEQLESPQIITEDIEKEKEIKDKFTGSTRSLRKMSTRSKTLSLSSATSESSIVESIMQEEEEKIDAKDYQEDTSRGKVKGSLFLHYMLAGGNICIVSFVFILYALAQASASGVDYFVSFWTNVEELRHSQPVNLSQSSGNDTVDAVRLPDALMSTYMCIYIYSGLIVALFVIALSRSMIFYKVAMIASENLHNNMFMNVIYTSMRFFDLNPSGRILNRFSKDMGAVDELLPKAILDAGQIILLMLGSLILVAVVNYMFLVPVAVIACVFLFLRVVFLRSSKNIKRLEGMMRSPVFTHLNATLQGLTTIRAYGAQDILKFEFDKHQDLHTSAWFMYITASSAFGFYLDVLCFIFTGLVTFSFLTIAEGLLGGQVGLAITQSTALTGLVQWGMRQSAEVANQLMSVERLLEYSYLPEEKQPDIPKTPPIEWPQKGNILFRKMGLRYSEDSPLVLKNLNISINAKEKVGIVGRTGAGKSSLIAALFRLATIEGDIDIDGIDTSELHLQFLRSKISIIPQDPVLFSGTLRYNLDPFDEYSDAELYRALDEVELKDPANIINKLENRVMDRGKNYSVGQRQLICLARAIVRKNKILMLDEATANVDPQTDVLIQKTIRYKFADCTVLTVAHRLNTIMDSDKVLVMEGGTMLEFDHPHKLLQDPNSKFSSMVNETGKGEKQQLENIARHSYELKFEASKI